MITANQSTVQEWIDFLKKLPDTHLREFEVQIGKKVSASDQSIKEILLYILENEHNMEVRFRAFFGLTFYLRRQQNFSELKKVVDQYIHEFHQIPLHYHVLALMYKSLEDKQYLKPAMYYSRQAIQFLPDHVGVLHCFCESVVTALEEGLEVEPSYIEDSQKFIDRVIDLSPLYGKFYCTKGRILAQQSNFLEAKKYILKAIDLEDDTSKDYMMRVSDYKNHLSLVKSRELIKRLEDGIKVTESRLDEAKQTIQSFEKGTTKKMEDLKTQNIQILGFFTAIISFIIASINLISSQSFLEAARLMLIFNGSTILSYIGFYLLFNQEEKSFLKLLFVSSLGIGMMVVGFLSDIFSK
jgi:tetratricopeptide (TPR) repeat protein